MGILGKSQEKVSLFLFCRKCLTANDLRRLGRPKPLIFKDLRDKQAPFRGS
jgi:hypothetical protein